MTTKVDDIVDPKDAVDGDSDAFANKVYFYSTLESQTPALGNRG